MATSEIQTLTYINSNIKRKDGLVGDPKSNMPAFTYFESIVGLVTSSNVGQINNIKRTDGLVGDLNINFKYLVDDILG